METQLSLIEDWHRRYAFRTSINLSCSGVQPYTFREVCRLLSISFSEIGQVLLRDGPSYGWPPLRKAISERFGKRNGDADSVLVTHGSSEALFLVMRSLLQEHDEVVTVFPSYLPHYSIPKYCGCRVKKWELLPEEGFRPNINNLRATLTRKTKMVICSFPHNPTGVSITEPQLNALVEAVADVGAYLLWDDSFRMLPIDTPPLPDPGQWYDRTVSFGTLSKAYGLDGLRIGWCQTTPDILQRCVMLRDYITLNLSPLTEFIACQAVRKPEVLIEPRLKQAKRNLQYLASWIDQNEKKLSMVPPQGGVSAFCRIPEINTDSLCKDLAEEDGVFLLPGTCFDCPEYVRLGFGGVPQEFRKGLKLLSRRLKQL